MAQHDARRTAHISLAACAAMLVLLAGCSADDPDSAAPSASGAASSSPAGVTALTPGGKDLRPLQPGRYGLTANGERGLPLAVVDLPAGMSSHGSFAVGEYAGELGGPYHALSYWKVAGVYVDPCGKKGGQVPPGPTAASLADALAAQNLTRTTAPQPVTIDGYHGVQLDLVAPTNVSYQGCLDGFFDVWDSSPEGGRYLQSPGQLLRLRILDLDGNIVVLETTASPPADTAGLAKMDRLAETVTFEDPSNASPS